jgi:hypothetical protein
LAQKVADSAKMTYQTAKDDEHFNYIDWDRWISIMEDAAKLN